MNATCINKVSVKILLGKILDMTFTPYFYIEFISTKMFLSFIFH